MRISHHTIWAIAILGFCVALLLSGCSADPPAVSHPNEEIREQYDLEKVIVSHRISYDDCPIAGNLHQSGWIVFVTKNGKTYSGRACRSSITNSWSLFIDGGSMFGAP